MKQKLIILLALLLLLVVVIFMIKDFFFDPDQNQKNPYAYELDEFRNVKNEQVCYKEVQAFEPGLQRLKGLAVDDSNRIYISGSGKLLIYEKNGILLTEINTSNEAGCITIGPDGKIYMGVKDHIEILNRTGEKLKVWKSTNEKSLITSIAVTDSEIYIADAGNKIVYQYNLSGELLNKIGRKNKEKGIPGFFIPSPYFDLLVGRDDELWVVNPGRHTFEAYNKNGELISSWKRTSMQLDGFSGCCNPSHIALLSDGSFVTSEKGLVRVKIHSPSGDFKCVVAQPDQFEKETRGLDLAVDSEDRVIVLDPMRKQVRIFEKNQML